MIFQILPNLSVARDLPQTYRGKLFHKRRPATAKLLCRCLFTRLADLLIVHLFLL